MGEEISPEQWKRLKCDGYLRIEGAFAGAASVKLEAAVSAMLQQYPHGFVNPPLYSGLSPTPRSVAPKPSDRAPTIIIPNIGFLSPQLLQPLANPWLHALLERILGKNFYLSNTWLQLVPPGTGRLAYHKDPRGSITFNILLDDIDDSMGSTCLVPASHINTPPPSFCMDNIQKPYQTEVDMTGKAGDLVLFSPETWHGRSDNFSSKPTRRLFYNFYSRSSRFTTAWNGIVSEEMLAAARAILPREYHHMFEIDPAVTRELASLPDGGIIRRWALTASTSNCVVRDIAYAWSVYGRATGNTTHPGFLLPYTTRLVEETPFSLWKYLSHFETIPTVKNMIRGLQRNLAAWVKFSRPKMVVTADG
jgi:Phytanoyl-CoA dioxygenase (PhyH)